MTVIKFGIDEMGKRETPAVSKCKCCEEFHLRAGNVLLTFTREEFSKFVNDTWDCYYGEDGSFSGSGVFSRLTNGNPAT